MEIRNNGTRFIDYVEENDVLTGIIVEDNKLQVGYNEEEILASNLVKKTNFGYNDVYRNRLMFPIQDVRNRFIAFGGRVLDNSLPKYINSPEGIVYNKGRNLYAMNVAKNANEKNIIMIITTKLVIAILFFFNLRRPSFQKFTLSLITTRLCFSSSVAGRKSSGFKSS